MLWEKIIIAVAIIIYISGLLGGLGLGVLVGVLVERHRQWRRRQRVWQSVHQPEPTDEEFAADLERWLDEMKVPA